MGKKVKKEAEPHPKDVFDPVPIGSKNPATVVLMLHSPEQEVLVKACEAMYKFAEKGDENKATLVELGAVEPLSKLISNEDKAVRMNAVMALGVMASHNDVKKLLKRLDVIPSILARLAPAEDTLIHEFASLCLAYLSVEYTSKVQIFELGGLDTLIHLLSSPDPDVKKNSLVCIYELVQDFPSRAAIQELNGIPPLLELLKSEYPVIQQLALKTLATITRDAETRVALRENQGFEQLIEILGNNELNDLHVETLVVVSNCMEDMDTVQLIQQTGGLDKLLQLAKTSTLPEVQMNAAKAITNTAQSNENRKILHEQEVEKTLVTLLRVDHEGLRTATCQAIAITCENLASKDEFRKLTGIHPVVQLLNSENVEVKKAAALALSNLTNANHLNANMYGLTTCEPSNVIYCICNETYLIKECLDTISLSVKNMGFFCNMDKELKRRTMTVAVAALACDSDARTELRNVGGLVPLVKLLNSKNDEVRRNACWAVLVCASDEPTAIEMCRLGALNILQEIHLSTSRKNNFSEAALQRLFDSNLSIKYSFTGCLSSSNKITDGFYDYCQVKPDHKMIILEELYKQKVNQHRPIVFINAKPPELALTELPPVEHKLPDSPSGHSPTPSKNSSKDKTPSKGKSKGKKEEEKTKEEDEIKIPQEVIVEKKQWLLPYDPIFHNLITNVTKSVLPLPNTKEQVVALAVFVAEKMGGPVERDRLHEFFWELHVSELQFQLQSNVIPIGQIKKGTFYLRALLFKALADRIGINCSLVRGEYNRACNEVLLADEVPKAPGKLFPPKAYTVDLMHSPGHLMKENSPEAIQYQCI
ncbi:armadillo repeat-containing protein 3 isoform X1 [Acipenser oxyrinchus oxyrinchus]|uniref:Armadillo repeat-containing protein 3 isoform X1 n=1 Tax=Acipenser oxyrinchus oxyrinchus TaxID=40147 RepID=A0AAD8GCT5_ACIOX|nr:armadillo repeat-containing protein 3 isoform X1 [Acipenser oxyrinchus oxyrinchus]